MLNSIDLLCSPPTISTIPKALTSLQQTTSKIFEDVKNSVLSSLRRIQQNLDFRPLLEPGNIVEGGLWAGFWGLSALFSGSSLYKLYRELTVEHPASDQFVKIGKAVKAAFIDLLSLGSATAYNARWAHDAKVLNLGRYAPLIKGLGYGASLVLNAVEGGCAIYNIYTEGEAILKETSPLQQYKHKQQLFLSLIKLIGNVCMVAWTVLCIIPLGLGVAVNPLYTSVLLGFGCILPVAAFFYQRHIEKNSEQQPLLMRRSLA